MNNDKLKHIGHSMKRWKKLLLGLLLIVLLSQIPFAYRRYRIGRLHAAIQLLNSQRRMPETNNRLAEYKGVVHVHSFLGGHSTGGFAEIISGAQANQLQFVIMTEHPAKDYNTAEMTLKGVHGSVLFVNGNEVRSVDGDRLLIVPGDSLPANPDRLSTTEIIANAKTHGSTAIVAYPEDFKSWGVGGYQGVEVYNVYTNARQINPVVAFFDTLWSHSTYPDLLFATFYKRPGENLKLWDQAVTSARLVATCGNDAHANIGISLNDDSGKTLIGLRLDPYETSFRLVRLHVLIAKDKVFDTSSLLEAISAGHCFIGFDLFGDTSGFSFEGQNPDETKIQGDEIQLKKETRLKVFTPVSSRIVLLKDGTKFMDETGLSSREYSVSETGIYRVEVYLPQLGKPIGEQPWIISNPILVK
jgi:hypothetical protein